MQRNVTLLHVEDDGATLCRIGAIFASMKGFCLSSTNLLSAGLSALEEKPDVLLVDIKLPDGDGTDLIRAVKERNLNTKILVLSSLRDEYNVVNAITLGANGYITKESSPRDIVKSVNDVLSGGCPLSSVVASHLVKIAQDNCRQINKDFSNLTPREIDVLWGIAKGLSYSDIAYHLSVSKQTIPSHIKKIYKKLGVNTRGEAVFEASQRGIIAL